MNICWKDIYNNQGNEKKLHIAFVRHEKLLNDDIMERMHCARRDERGYCD